MQEIKKEEIQKGDKIEVTFNGGNGYTVVKTGFVHSRDGDGDWTTGFDIPGHKYLTYTEGMEITSIVLLARPTQIDRDALMQAAADSFSHSRRTVQEIARLIEEHTV